MKLSLHLAVSYLGNSSFIAELLRSYHSTLNPATIHPGEKERATKKIMAMN